MCLPDLCVQGKCMTHPWLKQQLFRRKSGHCKWNGQIHQAYAHWLSQGMSVLRANRLPRFKPSILGSLKSPFYWWAVSYYSFPSGTQSMDITDQLPWQSISLIRPVPWFDFITVMKMGEEGSIFSAMKTFLLYILITFHFLWLSKEHISFFSGYFWNSKAVCQGGKGV